MVAISDAVTENPDTPKYHKPTLEIPTLGSASRHRHRHRELLIDLPCTKAIGSNRYRKAEKSMADGLNQARAMRIAEIMADYRNIQSYIASVRTSPSAEEYNEEGYMVLRHCVTEAQRLLSQSFSGARNANAEDVAQLRRILNDAAVRRFKAQKLYLKVTASLRWVNSRAAILRGQRPHAGHSPALQQIRNTLQAELNSITDQRVELSLRSPDTQAGKWLHEDPSLATMQRCISSGR